MTRPLIFGLLLITPCIVLEVTSGNSSSDEDTHATVHNAKETLHNEDDPFSSFSSFPPMKGFGGFGSPFGKPTFTKSDPFSAHRLMADSLFNGMASSPFRSLPINRNTNNDLQDADGPIGAGGSNALPIKRYPFGNGQMMSSPKRSLSPINRNNDLQDADGPIGAGGSNALPIKRYPSGNGQMMSTPFRSLSSINRNNDLQYADDPVDADRSKVLPTKRGSSGIEEMMKSMLEGMEMPMLGGFQPANQGSGNDGRNRRWGSMGSDMTDFQAEPIEINGMKGLRVAIQSVECCKNGMCYKLKAGEICGGSGTPTNNNKNKQQPISSDQSPENLIPEAQDNQQFTKFKPGSRVNDQQFKNIPGSKANNYQFDQFMPGLHGNNKQIEKFKPGSNSNTQEVISRGDPNILNNYPKSKGRRHVDPSEYDSYIPTSGPLNHPYVKPAGLSENEADEIRNTVLERTNFHRRNHNVPELKLNEALNNYAQEWANKLVDRDLQHRSDQIYGENLSQGKPFENIGQEAVDGFYDEIALFHPDDGEDDMVNNRKALHLTQLLWRASKRLGVGVSKNAKGRYTIVCNYDPSGNTSPLFMKNVPIITEDQIEAGKKREEEKGKNKKYEYTVVQSPMQFSSGWL